MPRIARFLKEDEKAVYHVISRTALDGLPFKDTDKEYLLELIKKWSRIFFVDVLGFAIMGNHFHLVVRMYPESEVSDDEVRKRYMKLYDLKHPVKIGDRQIILDTCLFQVLDEHCRKSARKGDIAGEFLTSYLISNSSAFGVSKDEFC